MGSCPVWDLVQHGIRTLLCTLVQLITTSSYHIRLCHLDISLKTPHSVSVSVFVRQVMWHHIVVVFGTTTFFFVILVIAQFVLFLVNLLIWVQQVITFPRSVPSAFYRRLSWCDLLPLLSRRRNNALFPVRCCCSYVRDALSCYMAMSSCLLEKLEVPVLPSGTKQRVRQNKGLEWHSQSKDLLEV